MTRPILREALLWLMSTGLLGYAVIIGIAYGEQTEIVERLKSDVASLAEASIQIHRDDERIKHLTIQQENMNREMQSQRGLLQEILIEVRRDR